LGELELTGKACSIPERNPIRENELAGDEATMRTASHATFSLVMPLPISLRILAGIEGRFALLKYSADIC
jgi:hypothetical protein